MATESQIAANRRNAENSTGPCTDEGKCRSSRNAVAFGIYSASDFVRPDEADTYQLFCQQFRKDLCPKGAFEQTLAAEVIHAAWRLRRCAVAESQMEPGAEDPILSRTQASIDRARGEAQRQLLRAAKELRRLQAERLTRVECLPETPAHAAPATPTKRTQSEPGHAAPAASTPRNAPCPCGSGTKYKRCCGRNAPPVLQQAA